MKWYLANGGALAVIVVGVGLTGYSSKLVGWLVVVTGAALFGVELAVGGYRLIHRRRHPQLTPAPEPKFASPEHRESIRTLLQGWMNWLQTDRPNEIHPTRRRIIGAHYPDVLAGMDDYNSVAARRAVAPTSLTDRFRAELRSLTLSEPNRFDTAGLAAAFGALTAYRVLNGIQDVSRTTEQLWDVFGPVRSGPPDGVRIKAGHEILIGLGGVPGDTYEQAARGFIAEVEPTFWGGQSWPETFEIANAQRDLEAFDRQPLMDRLDELVTPERIKVASGCPVCDEVA